VGRFLEPVVKDIEDAELNTLSTEDRRQLERTIVEARDIAETGARGALEALAVHYHEPFSHMSGEQRKLRNRLRAHARHLGDRVDARSGAHAIDHLVNECAYEHWHGMLFARFLAENHLLIEPEMGVAITLYECEELAKEEGVDKWALAARFAHRMLPQVFRPDHPVFEVQFAREYRLKLEDLVEGLPADVFTTTDGLGWVYQFWQTKKKDEVNRSEVKIGADELPAVTQLFTEPYMVQFVLHNSLGAWWVSRHTNKRCPVDLTYLRQTEDGEPAAGAFVGWPDDLAEFRLLDPCCGSGHFLVAAFLMLTPMRMALEGLDAAQAVDAVLRENIHGLELDQRCVAIAAFALALEAWRYSDAGGFRTLPKLNLAWCGQPVGGKKEQWLALAEGDSRIEAGMAALHDTFRDAPTLGSLIDPARCVSEDMLSAGFEELQPLLGRALRQHAGEEEWEETAIAATGLAETARLLGARYHLIATNVPYVSLRKQVERLSNFTKQHYPASKQNLALVLLERTLQLCADSGGFALVLPQDWTFLDIYEDLRRDLLKRIEWRFVAKLGVKAFQTPMWDMNIMLFIGSRDQPNADSKIRALDVSHGSKAEEKEIALRTETPFDSTQLEHLDNPDARLVFGETTNVATLAKFADAFMGVSTGDGVRFQRCFWEVQDFGSTWQVLQSTVSQTQDYGGRSEIIRWEGGRGEIYQLAQEVKHLNHAAQNWARGAPSWGKRGVVVSQMGDLPATVYSGDIYDCNCVAIVPFDESNLEPLWAFCSSHELASETRRLNQALKVPPKTILKVPFDISKWQKRAEEVLVGGLPSPCSNDPTQMLFSGHPRISDTPLMIAAVRLVGFHWPSESNTEMELAEEQRVWVEKAKALYPIEDEDGIVCIPSVRGERPAQERLLQMLHVVYGNDWSDGILAELLTDCGSASLDDWLRNQFFPDHCKLFQYRPFIWHIWDGRKRDGFHALVNYHKLAEGDGKGRRLLESLTYSYLGDWIARQQDGVKRGEGGAEDRLAAAFELQKRLVAILEGEPPFDIFVRWKPVEQQPIGWEPDINDGVRLNIRPFMAQDLPGGKKGAGILRAKPNIHWKKDRGKEPTRDEAQFPWFWKNGKFAGDRVNDVHLTNAEKRAAREAAGTAAKGK